MTQSKKIMKPKKSTKLTKFSNISMCEESNPLELLAIVANNCKPMPITKSSLHLPNITCEFITILPIQ